mmetsp:Transcript_51070/g.119533  ORF Transcript_51070/g.119533 Transcript_51070/m.119533 type:complete len:523 (+) Transcript_51070:82-1650(+)
MEDIQQCPYCGGTDIHHDSVTGDVMCGSSSCGQVLAEGDLRAEVTFVQTSSGGAAAAATRVMSGGTGGSPWGVRNGEELSLQKGVHKITWIADRLQLSQQVQDAARRIYQISIQLGMVYPARHQACACLYWICRRQKSPQLLIDFSDVVQTSVRTLGGVYVKLMRRLVGSEHGGGLDVPVVDPSLYLERYARKLDAVGMGYQRKVQQTALRLIQFMHREWICVGRRPNGLCGAALLIATYYHGLRVSAKEIGDVVRIGDTTIKLRLWELRETPLRLLDKKAFEEGNLEAEQRGLPPCFMRNRSRKEVLAVLNGTFEEALPILDSEAAKGVKNIREALMLGEGDQPNSKSRKAIEDASSAASANAIALAALVENCEAPLVGVDNEPSYAGTPSEADPPVAASSVGGETEDVGVQESLSDVDDSELSQWVLDDESREAKSNIWHEVNKDYLEEWHTRAEDARRKRKHASADNISETKSRASKTSKRSRRSFGSASSPVESAVVGLKSKVKTHRINLEALEELFA